MQEQTKQTRDIKGAVITGVVGLVLAALLVVAHQVVWGGLTLLLAVIIALYIGRRPKQPAHPQDRAAITEAERRNQFQPLTWEPVATAQAATAWLTEKVGDQGWQAESSTLGISAPLRFELKAADGARWVVYATGAYERTAAPAAATPSEVTPAAGKATPETGQPNAAQPQPTPPATQPEQPAPDHHEEVK